MNESDLHGYQVTSITHIKDNPFAGLLLDMGLGKTVSTLTAVNQLIYEELDVDRVLVIAPKRVAETVWTAERDKWEHLRHLTISRIIGTEKKRRAALAARADVYIISRDNIAWLCGQYGGSMLPFDMLIVDESSSFKNHKSLRFKALKQVQPSFSRVVLLTGTPAPNGLIDLWAQIYLLDRGERLGQTIGAYRREYFTPGASKGHIVYNYKLRNHSDDRIHKAIEDICISMKAEDYLDLPECVENVIEVTFPGALMKKYEDFEREAVLDLLEGQTEGDEISAMNAAALSNKLLQFANGAIYDENKNWHEVHDLKLDALEEVVENAQGRPVLIAWAYRHDMYRIHARLKKYGPRALKTEQDIKDWNNGLIQVLTMHPASGGHGLNLQAGGNIIVWFGLTWSLELLQQLNARLNRQGQEHGVVINKIKASGTMDEDVIKSNKRKAGKQEGLMQAVKARIKKYVRTTGL